MLLSRRRLRDYRNYIRLTQGFNKDVVNEIFKSVNNFSQEEKHVIFSLDENRIQEDLVWHKHTGDLIGYVDLGNTELNAAALKKMSLLHMYCFL